MCVCVCLSSRVLITNCMTCTCNNWLNLFYSFSVYMTLATDKMDGCGLSNTYSMLRTSAKEDKGDAVLAAEGGI